MSVIIDGTNLIHRIWYSPGSPQDPKGIAFRLALIAAKACDRAGSKETVICFDGVDASKPRKALLDSYKAHRSEKDPGLAQALDEVPGILAQAGFQVAKLPMIEADDLLADAVKYAPVFLLTSDKDAYALVTDTVTLLRPANGGMLQEVTRSSIRGITGVDGNRYLEFAALRGDPSDGIPGLSSVGVKKAAQLLENFASFEDFIADLRDGGMLSRPVLGPKATLSMMNAVDDIEALLELNLRLMSAMPCDCPAPVVPLRAGLEETFRKWGASPNAAYQAASSLSKSDGTPPPWAGQGNLFADPDPVEFGSEFESETSEYPDDPF